MSGKSKSTIACFAITVITHLLARGSPKRCNEKQSQVMAGRKTDHPTGASLRFRTHEWVSAFFDLRGILQQSREIIGKNKRGRIFWVARSTSSFISGTKITGRIVGRQCLWWQLFHAPLPRALGAMRRDQNPITGKLIQPSMGKIQILLFNLFTL